jgi:hypothetical protein
MKTKNKKQKQKNKNEQFFVSFFCYAWIDLKIDQTPVRY